MSSPDPPCDGASPKNSSESSGSMVGSCTQKSDDQSTKVFTAPFPIPATKPVTAFELESEPEPEPKPVPQPQPQPQPQPKSIILQELQVSYQQATEIDHLNQSRLHQALCDAGEQSQGISAIEAWVLNERHTHLVRPEGAWWRDPTYKPSPDLNFSSAMTELARLEDTSRDDYHQLTPMQPGQGLVGKLWSHGPKGVRGFSESGSYHGVSHGLGSSSSSFRRLISAPGSMRSFFSGNIHLRTDFNDSARATFPNRRGVYWIDLEFLLNDEEHIPEDRMRSFIHAGMGKAKGIIFDVRGYRGIVIYFAKTEIQPDILLMESNATFLVRAADCIGAVLALAEPRRSAMDDKYKFDHILSSDEEDELELSRRSRDQDNLNPTQIGSQTKGEESYYQRFQSKLKLEFCMFRDKIFGKKIASPPPSMVFSESMWVFFGSLITLSLTLFLSQGILFWNGSGPYTFPIGPLGALSTLLFGLTAAPVSQPNNVFYGSLVSGVTGICFSKITWLPHWFRVSLGTSFAITFMTKLGITHPPGGALAVVYSTGNYHWGHLLLSLLANLIAVGVAILVNNLNEKRQYPQYWGLNPLNFFY